MKIERHVDAVVLWAPAKVNLYLEVLGKRTDGYHEIATLMVAISLYDTLEFKEDANGDVHLDCDQPGLSTGPDNLIRKAARLLQVRTGCQRGARISLKKRIPIAAGLAGGSTDAAATLAGLNRLWSLGLGPQGLAELAAQLGSDVAFFFATPAAWCTGRGELVRSLTLGATLWFVVVCPPVGMSTAAVYQRLRVPDQPQSGEAIRRAASLGHVEELGRLMHNRLQPAAEELNPDLGRIRDQLRALGAAGSMMSGSGSSWFALCRDRGEAERFAGELNVRSPEGMQSRVFIVHSCV